jgi:hypothetical protein
MSDGEVEGREREDGGQKQSQYWYQVMKQVTDDHGVSPTSATKHRHAKGRKYKTLDRGTQMRLRNHARPGRSAGIIGSPHRCKGLEDPAQTKARRSTSMKRRGECPSVGCLRLLTTKRWQMKTRSASHRSRIQLV